MSNFNPIVMRQFYALLCLLLFSGACSEDDTPNPAVKFSSPDSDVKISQDGTSAAITATHHAGQFVLTMEKNFEAVPESDRSWCTAVLSGDRLTVEIEENAEELRNAAISIMNGESVIGKITVEQGVAPTLSLESNTAEFTNEGGGIDPITVTTNQERWDAACDAGWITISKEGDKLRLTASPNPDGGNRPAVVTVTTGCKDNPAEVSAAINVTQGPPSLILEYTVPAGGKIILPLSGAIDCTVDYGDGYSEKLALTLNPATGSLINYEYAEAGVYEVSVSGSVEQLYSLQGHSETSRSYLTAVKQWGNVNLTSMYYAFYLCSNLKTLPENTTDSFAEVTTFKYAFEGCSGLQTIPASLFSGCDKVTDVLGCFTKCASLTSVPENLLAPLKNVTSLQSFLAHCKQLKTIPAGFFARSPQITTLKYTFSGNTAFETLPAGLFKRLANATNFEETFYGCTALKEIPDEFFAGCTSADIFRSCFFGNKALTKVGRNVFKGCTNVTSYKWLLANCTELVSVPADMFDDSRKVTDFSGTFRDAAKLAVESPYTTIDGVKVHIYERSLHPDAFTAPKSFGTCFRGCTALTDWEAIGSGYAAWTK